MTILRTLRLLGLGAVLGLATSSCVDEPDYSKVPEIEMNRVEYKLEVDPQTTGEVHLITLVVNFKDGDGDLGLDSEMKNPPYAEKMPDGSKNKFYNNYFVRIFRQNQQGNWEPFFIGASTELDAYDSRYPPLNPDGGKQPLRGELFFKLPGQARSNIPSGTVLRFEISIADRALNVSNTVVSEPVRVQ